MYFKHGLSFRYGESLLGGRGVFGAEEIGFGMATPGLDYTISGFRLLILSGSIVSFCYDIVWGGRSLFLFLLQRSRLAANVLVSFIDSATPINLKKK